MIRRAVIVAAVIAAAISIAAAWPRSPVRTAVVRQTGEVEQTVRVGAARCGVERWPVKTLTDPGARQVIFRAHPATVAFLGSLPAQMGGQDTRSALEQRVYGVDATLVKAKLEADSDIHMVLEAGGATMIAESPDVGCTRGAQHRYAMFRARQKLGQIGDRWTYLNWKVHLVGVLFFDFPHGQSGHADNYSELHPVLAIRRDG